MLSGGSWNFYRSQTGSCAAEANVIWVHSGQIGFMICAKARAEGPPLDPRTPRRPAPEAAISGYPPLRCALHDMVYLMLPHVLDDTQQASVMSGEIPLVHAWFEVHPALKSEPASL